MKTLDEVIKANECCDHGEPDSRCEDCPYNGIGACALERETDALHYLKMLRDMTCGTSQKLRNTSQITCPKCHSEFVILPESNNALTWEELKQMVGKPVWLEDSNQQGEWVLLSGMEDDVLYFVYRTCNEYKIYRKEQGTLWQAYRKERP